MPPYKRYFTDYDRSGLTADELSVKPEDEQINYMVAWFNHYFDNPMTTGLRREDDNFVYDWGGPYEAGDELDREFNTFLGEDAISKAVARVDAGGIGEWAPSDNHPDRQVRPSKRYYTVEDYDGLTPSSLKEASEADQIRYMKHWFWTFYEDPSASMPHISAEGGFQYIWGGPYDAMEELFNEFDGIVSEDRIRKAAESVQSDGTYDWAPSPQHPNRREDREEFQAGDELSEESPEELLADVIRTLERGTRPSFGTADELAQREEILDRFKIVEAEIAKLNPKRPAPRNHNNPPELIRDEFDDQLDDLTKAVADIKGEMGPGKTPDALKVAGSTSRLFAFVKFCAKKLAEKAAEKVAEKALDSMIVQGALQALKHHVYRAAGKVLEWLMNISIPF